MGRKKTADDEGVRTLVYRFGCLRPDNEPLAEQLLGQAWLYAEDLRHVYNRDKRRQRERLSALAEASHVRAYEEHLGQTDDVAHVLAFERAQLWEKSTRNEEICGVRATRGHVLDWGTYTLLETAMEQAAKTSKDRVKPKPWTGEGRIGAAIRDGQHFPASAWKHTRVQLTEPDERKHALLTIVVGDLPPRKSKKNPSPPPPTKITWPIKLHRPFPEGAIVKQVAVQRVRNGHRFKWEALVTISFVDTKAERDTQAEGVVGVDLGWRRETDDSQRVATHYGEGEVDSLTTDTLRSMTYSSAVQGIRDKVFDEAKAYVADAKLPGGEHAKKWRNKAHMYRLAKTTGDDVVKSWVERDKHLEDIEAGVRRHAINRRLNAYRVYADTLAKKYRFVALEDLHASDFVNKCETHAAEARRKSAGLHLLQGAIVERFGEKRVHWVPPANTSRTCSCCGEINEALGLESAWKCPGCGTEHHRDENAAKNLALHCERWLANQEAGRARSKKPMTPKKKKKKAPGGGQIEAAENDGARKEVDEAAE